MGFLSKIASVLGFQKNDREDVIDEDEEADDHHNLADKAKTRQSTSGFSVQVPVAVDRAHAVPVLTLCDHGDGGVQSLRWFAKRLRIDEDWDVAEEFREEVSPETSAGKNNHKSVAKLVVKYSARPVILKNQAIAIDGSINHHVEFHGRFLCT